MAKALFGHVGTPDLRLRSEVRRLQTRVAELEAEVSRVRAANVALAARVTVDDELLRLEVGEPALT